MILALVRIAGVVVGGLIWFALMRQSQQRRSRRREAAEMLRHVRRIR
jgi:preprotein translocase subunit YajC